jgi:tetratricopeptide (TPR) repeat protein
MSSLFDFGRQIRQITGEKRYSDALNFFKENKTSFNETQISNNQYLIADILTCLRHENFFDAGFLFLSTYGIEINDKTSERILTAYGWLLWSKYKAENSNENDNFENEGNPFEEKESTETFTDLNNTKPALLIKIQELIPLLYKQNTEFSKNLISFLFSIVLKTEKQRPAPNWRLINDFCNEFEPNNLSVECRTIKVERKGKIKDMELASDKESWFAYKTKALLKLGDWTGCFELSKKALATFEVFHYSNDIWFARRIALAKKNLGNSSEAISELKAILNTKKEWFIQKELAELYFEANDIENAFKYAMQAIINLGPLEFKVDLLFLIGQILSIKNENKLAFKHYSLSKLIRQNEGWKTSQELFEKLQAFDNPETPLDDISKLKSELKNYWSNFKSNNIDSGASGTMEGLIFKILNHNERGKDGFLKCNNTEYYFSVSANFHLTSRVEMNTKVLFQLLPANAGKKYSAKIIKIID